MDGTRDREALGGTIVRRARLGVVVAVIAAATACGVSTSGITAVDNDAVAATSTEPVAGGCARWLRTDAVAPDLAAAADAVRHALDEYPHTNVTVDHATPARIRVQVVDRRDEIEPIAKAAAGPKLAPRVLVELIQSDPQSAMNLLFGRVGEFLKDGPAPLSEVGLTSLGIEIVIELKSETHACEFADAVAQHFPTEPVFIKVWPPASLAEEAKDFFGNWTLSAADAAVLQIDPLALRLLNDGTFQMPDRCNWKTGRWNVDGNHGAFKTIAFTNIGITMAACPSRPDVINVPRSGQLNGSGQLVIETADGQRLTYEK